MIVAHELANVRFSNTSLVSKVPLTRLLYDDLPETEQADFLDICTEGGIAPEEFNVSFAQEIAGDREIKTCGRSIIVQFGATTPAYEDSQDLPWIVQFDEDIKAQVFS